MRVFKKIPPIPPEPAEARNPIGPQNDIALIQLARQQIRRMFPRRRHALRPTAAAQPAHPLYLPQPAQPFLLK